MHESSIDPAILECGNELIANMVAIMKPMVQDYHDWLCSEGCNYPVQQPGPCGECLSK